MTIPTDRAVVFDAQRVPLIEFAAVMTWLNQLQQSDMECLAEDRVARVIEAVRQGAELTEQEAKQLSLTDVTGLLAHIAFGGRADTIPPSNGTALLPGPTA